MITFTRLVTSIALALLCALPAFAKDPARLTYTRPSMGTVFTITLYAEDEPTADKAADAALDRVERINALASDYLPESELSRFNKTPANMPFPLSPDLFSLIHLSLQVARESEGAFDITAAYAVQQWRRARRQKKLPTPEETRHAVAMTDYRQLALDAKARTLTKLKPGLLIDLGGIGKGYAADEALKVLRTHGITQAVVAASGDLSIGDPPPGKAGWDITLRTFEAPEEKDRRLHLTLKNCGCSTSGDLHQFLELDGRRYSHIIDPKTGLGLTTRIACTVIAPDATTSDMWDTAGCILGVARGPSILKEQGCEVRMVTVSQEGTHTVYTPAFAVKQ